METENILIIGSGPAGYTAAIYAARAGLNPILYQGNQPGGQLTTTSEVENYPGYPNGVLGTEMMQDFEKQAARFGTRIKNSLIVEVDFDVYPYSATAESGEKIFAKAIIIATGSSAKWLGLPSEKRLNGRGVSACAICDGFFFRNKDIVVVGGGDTAAEESLYLSKLCKKVYLLVRSEVMRASDIMRKRVEERENIEILYNSATDEILGENEVEGVRIVDTVLGSKREIHIEGFFVAIGHNPNTKIFAKYLELNDSGYIKTIPGSTKTNLKGVFAAGDVQDSHYRQAITAAGSGCMAALDAEKFLAIQ